MWVGMQLLLVYIHVLISRFKPWREALWRKVFERTLVLKLFPMVSGFEFLLDFLWASRGLFSLFTTVLFWFVACVDEPIRRGARCGVGQYNVCYKQCWLVNQ